MSFFRRNLEEISGDPRLRSFGALLALAQLFAAIWWWHSDLAATLARGSEALCWPFFPGCAAFRVLSRPTLEAIVLGFGALALVDALLYARTRTVAHAYVLAIALELVRAALVFQDFRLRLNQHYMAFFAALVFLFLPQKRRNLRILVVLFYFWAGTLKLSREWLSGAALYAKPWLVPHALIPAACAYVAVLELFLVWGVLARTRWIYLASLCQLVLFAIVSVPVVGAYYPLLMLVLLSVFPLFRSERELPAALGPRLRATPAPTWGMVAAFSALQLWPRIQPGDPAITGEGRWLALHMFDARVVCQGFALVTHDERPIDHVDLQGALATRIRCDPIVYLDRARALCRQMHDAGATGLDLAVQLDARRSTDPSLRPVLRLRHFCTAAPHYDPFGFNAFILR